MVYALLFSVFVIATCGLVYELIAGALASYLLGDSVTQFSTIIGTYLFSMGIGSWLSKYVRRNLLSVFIRVEFIIGLVGGCSAAILFVLFEHMDSFRVALYGLVSLTGMLVGLEIPLLMRILKDRFKFEDLVSQVFTFDYVGALLASLLFPLVLVPGLGLVKSGFLFGLFNALVGLWTLSLFKDQIEWLRSLRASGVVVTLILLAGFVYSERIMSVSEASNYQDPVVFARSTAYQRIVLTHRGDDVRLWLNGNLQFSSRDEYRYHEALVHPGLSLLKAPKRVLILGGGDGFAAREVLRYPSVESVTLVDLDPEMTTLFTRNDALASLNGQALRSPKVRVINADAFQWLKDAAVVGGQTWDFIVVDFPDPSNFSLGKLYSNTFFRVLYRAVGDQGAAVIQSTSPLIARRSFWCIDETLRSVGFETGPYHAFVPSFGEWGFILARKAGLGAERTLPAGLRFVSESTLATLFHFPDDMGRLDADVNKLNNQVLVRYFEDEWSRVSRN